MNVTYININTCMQTPNEQQQIQKIKSYLGCKYVLKAE